MTNQLLLKYNPGVEPIPLGDGGRDVYKPLPRISFLSWTAVKGTWSGQLHENGS